MNGARILAFFKFFNILLYIAFAFRKVTNSTRVLLKLAKISRTNTAQMVNKIMMSSSSRKMEVSMVTRWITTKNLVVAFMLWLNKDCQGRRRKKMSSC